MHERTVYEMHIYWLETYTCTSPEARIDLVVAGEPEIRIEGDGDA